MVIKEVQSSKGNVSLFVVAAWTPYESTPEKYS